MTIPDDLSARRMVHIYSIYLEDLDDKRLIQEFLPLLPTNLQAKIKTFKFAGDAQLSLFGKLLLQVLVYRFQPGYRALDNLCYTIHNRPYLPDRRIDFSISHAGNYVLVAASAECHLGIDIEKIRLIDLEDFTACLSEQERYYLHSKADAMSSFFQLWTKKEAIIKADGRGLFIPLNGIDIKDNKGCFEDQEWHLHPLLIRHDYRACLATDVALSSNQILYAELSIRCLRSQLIYNHQT